MKRTIIKIDEEKCNGCGLCVKGCHEGALQIIDGKARMVSETYCDGLGACIGECPLGAIELEEREAEPYDEQAVQENTQKAFSCPGKKEMLFERDSAPATSDAEMPSQLRQWPVQLHLLNPMAPYLKNADVVLAADCSAFAYGDFHGRFLKNRILAIACPKLDSGRESYIEKLTAMIDYSNINTLTIVMMEVPCCGGLLQLAQQALAQAKRKIPVKKVVISLKGEILQEEWGELRVES